MLLSFQLTPSRRATLARLQLAMRIGISTHALTEGDSSSWELIPKLFISTHALTEGDHHHAYQIADYCDFNSRPHGGRRSKLFKLVCADFISTHALTEGDPVIDCFSSHADISTHALTEGD